MAKVRSAVGIASLIWGGSILLSRVIGLIREGAIGRIVGGGAEADTYSAAFSLPDYYNHLLAGGALSLVFIPIFGGYLSRGEEEEGWEAFSVIANFLGSALLVLTPLLWLAAPVFAPLIAPGFDPLQTERLVTLIRIILPAQIFHVLGGLLSATLQARDKHGLAALAPLVYNAGIIAGGLIGGREAGAEGFAWGVLVGSALGPFGLPLYGNLREGIRWKPIFSLSHPDFRSYIARSIGIMLGFSVAYWDDLLQRNQGSLLEEGAVATLNYAKTLLKVPMGVFGLAIGAAAYPTLTRLIAQGQHAEGYTLLSHATRRMLVLALGAQVVMTAAGPEIARVIYGNRLLEGQHEAIGAALGWMGIGLWAWAAQTVISRGFYALGRTWTPTIIGSIATALAIPLYLILRAHLGIAGLAIASSLAISGYVVALIVALRRLYPGVPDGFEAFFAKMLPATAASILAALALRWAGLVQGVLPGAIVAVISGLIFLVLILALRVPEAREVIELITNRLRRRRRSG